MACGDRRRSRIAWVTSLAMLAYSVAATHPIGRVAVHCLQPTEHPVGLLPGFRRIMGDDEIVVGLGPVLHCSKNDILTHIRIHASDAALADGSSHYRPRRRRPANAVCPLARRSASHAVHGDSQQAGFRHAQFERWRFGRRIAYSPAKPVIRLIEQRDSGATRVHRLHALVRYRQVN